MASKHIERCSALPTMNKIHIKTTPKYRFLNWQKKFLNIEVPSIGKGSKETGPLIHWWWEFKLVQSF